MSQDFQTDNKFCIVGIDPAIVNVGWSVFTKKENSTFCFVKGGVFSASEKEDLATRYNSLRNDFVKIIKKYKADFVVFEDVDFRNTISRKTQAYLFGSLAVFLSVLPPSVGYILISKYRVNKILSIEKGKSKEGVQKRYAGLIKRVSLPKSKIEHFADSIALVEAFLIENNYGTIEPA